MVYTPIMLGTGLSAYSFLERTKDQQRTAFANSAEVARNVSHFEANIEKIENVDQLLADRQLLGVVLGAFGLQDDIDNSGFIRKVLESDLDDPRSFVNRLNDSKYQSLAKTMNFAGNARLLDSDARDDIRESLARVSSVEALFDSANSRLLDRALEVFDLEGDAARPTFLQRVLSSDVDDPTSLVNRLENKDYLAFAKAFQGVESQIDASFLRTQSDDIINRLEAVNSVGDLMDDRALLRSVLTSFGLEDQINNTFMLQSVFESDLTDPDSFANQQRDPAMAEMAAVFNFFEREQDSKSIYGFTRVFEDKLNSFSTADDLLADSDALEAALSVFGLENDTFLENETNLRAVLDSDLSDDASFANTLEDGRYAALANIFAFAEIAGGEPIEEAQSALNDMVEEISSRAKPLKTGEEVNSQAQFIVRAMNFFDLPGGLEGGQRFNRISTSDPTNPLSLVNLVDDNRYVAYFEAMNFQTEESGRSYPNGFTARLTEAYLTRQYEIAVGNVDNDMRIAISMERELTEVVERASTVDGQWFTVMSSPPLRAVFESAFNLPQSFGTLDLDRQLVDFKERSIRFLGTDSLSEILNSDVIDQLREDYLTKSQASVQAPASGLQIASTLLAGAFVQSPFG